MPREVYDWWLENQYKFFRHRKGGNYQVREVAICSETLKPHVIYRGEYDMWMRPFEEFTDGRFTKIN